MKVEISKIDISRFFQIFHIQTLSSCVRKKSSYCVERRDLLTKKNIVYETYCLTCQEIEEKDIREKEKKEMGEREKEREGKESERERCFLGYVVCRHPL